MKRRKIGILLTVAVISLSAIGCGQKETTETQTEQTEAVESVETETSEATEAIEIEETESTEALEEISTEEASTDTSESTGYTYTDLSKMMYAQKTVNVRDLPDTSGNKVGGLSTNDEVSVSGQCNETGWYRISYNGGTAYVSNNYLGDSKVEIQQATSSSDNSNVSESSNTLSNCPYQLNTIFDDGGDYVYYYYVDTVDSMHGTAKEAMYAKGYDDNNIIWSYEEVGTFLEGHVLKCTMKNGQW